MPAGKATNGKPAWPKHANLRTVEGLKNQELFLSSAGWTDFTQKVGYDALGHEPGPTGIARFIFIFFSFFLAQQDDGIYNYS